MFQYRRPQAESNQEYFVYYLIFAAIGLILLWLISRSKKKPIVFSHWFYLSEGLLLTVNEFYKLVEDAVKSRRLPEAELEIVDLFEGSVLSAKRVYLRVARQELNFDLCAAPFGTGFFVSWWLGTKPSWLANVPFIGHLLVAVFRPLTYYRLDTAMMFQESVHNSVLEVLGGILSAKGLRSLTDMERKPILNKFFHSNL